MEMQHCDAFDYWGKGTEVTVSSVSSPAVSPTLFPLVVCQPSSGDKITVGCLANDFSPKTLTFQWTNAGGATLTSAEYPPASEDKQALLCTIKVDKSGKLEPLKWKKNDAALNNSMNSPIKRTGELQSAVSVLEVSQDEWEQKHVYTCETTYKSQPYERKISNASITVMLKQPSAKTIFHNNQAQFECVITGQDKTIVDDTDITWQINGGNVASSAVTEFTDQEKSAEVTLVCLVSSPVQQDFYIAWSEHDGQTTTNYVDGVNFLPEKTKDGYLATSVYTISKTKWDGSSQFFCNVWPAGRNESMDPKGVSKIMVSSPVASPTLFPLVACQPGSGDKITVGCLANDFSPKTLTFQWTNAGGAALTSAEYPPAVKNNKYTAVSLLEVFKSDWDSMKSFKCSVNHQGSSKTLQMKKPYPTKMTLVSVQSEDKQALLCTIKVDKSGTLEPLKWKKNDAELTNYIKVPIQRTGELQSAMSVLEVSQDEWEQKHVYTCETTYKSQPYERKISNASITVMLKQPSAKTIFHNNQAQLECVMTGEDKTIVDNTDITWQINGGNVASSAVTVDGSEPKVTVHTLPGEFTDQEKSAEVTLVCLVSNPVQQDFYIAWSEHLGQTTTNYVDGVNFLPQKTKDGYLVTSVYTISKTKWDGNNQFYCNVWPAGRNGSMSPKGVSKAMDGSEPKVTVHILPGEFTDQEKSAEVTLVCLVSSPVQQDFYIAWSEHVGNSTTNYVDGVNFLPEKTKDGYLVTSVYTISKTKWDGNDQFYCNVWPAGRNKSMSPKAVSKAMDGSEPKVTVHILPGEFTDKEKSAEVTLVCLVSSPVQQDFYIAWSEHVGNSTTNYVDGINFPPQKTKDGYLVTSVYTITKTEWDGNKQFYCNVWPAGRNKFMRPNGVSKIMEWVPPKMTLLLVPNEVNQALICTVEVYQNLALEPLKWKMNDKELNNGIQIPIQRTGESQSSMSVLQIRQDDWNNGHVYTCETTYYGQTYTNKIFKGLITVTLKQPNGSYVLTNNKTQFECVITGQNETVVDNTDITWQLMDKVWTETLLQLMKQSLTASNGSEPKVTVHTLQEEFTDQEKSGEVTLVCLVSSPVQRDFYIAWSEQKGQNYPTYHDGVNFPPQKTKDGYLVTSVYTINRKKWNEHNQFYCSVWPAGNDRPTGSNEVAQAKYNAVEC
ncbi:hypothetical protein INR49_011227 [Caranx melampygus]|nr:hypothetical protein INR49_011227 [Caranx melampygus]